MGKIPHTSIFGTGTQIIPNQTSLREKNQKFGKPAILCSRKITRTDPSQTAIKINYHSGAISTSKQLLNEKISEKNNYVSKIIGHMWTHGHMN